MPGNENETSMTNSPTALDLLIEEFLLSLDSGEPGLPPIPEEIPEETESPPPAPEENESLIPEVNDSPGPQGNEAPRGPEENEDNGSSSHEENESPGRGGNDSSTDPEGTESLIVEVGGSPSEHRNDVGQTYLEFFRSQRRLVPHWRNVLAMPRSRGRPSIMLLRPQRRAGVRVFVRETYSDGLDPRSLAGWLGLDPESQPLQVVLVRDLSEALINSLGPVLHLSPEVFEEHLVQSGYTATSYEDRESRAWPTRFIGRELVSLRWYSLVLRNDIEPRDPSLRQLLLKDHLEWIRPFRDNTSSGGPVKWRKRFLYTLTNIFRQEWFLSFSHRPLHTSLVLKETYRGSDKKLVDTGERDIFEELPKLDDRPDDQLDVVAWEERITFCWGRQGQLRVPIFFFDPLPQMKMKADFGFDGVTRDRIVMPFLKRLVPRGPPPMRRLDDDPTTMYDIYEYANSRNDALSDTTAWLEHVAGHVEELRTPLDCILFSIFRVVWSDTVVLLDHIDDVLDQISSGTMDETKMQEQLGQWRTLLNRLQRELPALRASLARFFEIPYSLLPPPGGSQPAPLTGEIGRLIYRVTALFDRCQKVQESLRTEMSLLESKRGIEEAESVSRLTELAFIFIPMTFAASLFSMQIRETIDNPPPAWAFVITAVIAVAVSYTMRIAQQSTMISSAFRSLAHQIRHDKQVTTRNMPIREIVKWLVNKVGTGLLIFLVSIGIVCFFLVALWTGDILDQGFKGALTGLVLLCLSAATFAAWAAWAAQSDWFWTRWLPTPPTTRPSSVWGFGPIWRVPSAVGIANVPSGVFGDGRSGDAFSSGDVERNEGRSRQS